MPLKNKHWLIFLIAFHFHLKAEKLQIPSYPIEIAHPPLEAEVLPKIGFHTLPEAYLNQVIQRKTESIQNCAEKQGRVFRDFLVELTIFPSGRTQSRLINSDSQDKEVLKCVLRILNRIQFKKFTGPPILKGYHFQSTS